MKRTTTLAAAFLFALTVYAADPVVIRDDAFYPLQNIAKEMKFTVRADKDLDFELEEDLANNKKWTVKEYDARIIKVEIDHDRADDPGEKDKAEFEVEGIIAGSTTLELVYGNNEKTVKIHVTVTQ
ncbi:MAG: hypothetical protein IKB22_02975 [Lentisphaeria bacterium]|nr:hypothetical protein [Lentisphaeria bacterium]